MRGRFRRTKRVLFHLAVRGLQGLARGLPRAVALRVFAAIAGLVHAVDRPAVRRSLRHLEIAFGPPASPDAHRRLVRAMFTHTARNLVDVLRPFPAEPERATALVRFEGLEHLEAARRGGRGVIALSAHLGNWEVLGAALAARGVPVDVVAQKVFEKGSDRMLNAWRRAAGITVHRRGTGLSGVQRALGKGHVVGMLVDQDTPGPSVFATFFGRLARTPRSPFVLARRTGAALVPMWIRMDDSGVHVARVEPEIPRSEGRGEAALVADAEAWHRRLEAAIRTCPEQWVWHHRRWRSRPLATVTDLGRRRRSLAPADVGTASWEASGGR